MSRHDVMLVRATVNNYYFFIVMEYFFFLHEVLQTRAGSVGEPPSQKCKFITQPHKVPQPRRPE